jgi:homoserine trans-succinylase
MNLTHSNIVKDSLYNCFPCASDKTYSNGIIVGLVSGIMATGYSFEDTLYYLKKLVKDGIFDLEESHVYSNLPDCWKSTWDGV